MPFITKKKVLFVSQILLMGVAHGVMAYDEHEHHDHEQHDHHHEHELHDHDDEHHHTSTVEAHVHGEANLNIIIDGEQIVAEFISPLANLLGFEHEPETTEQKQAYKALQDSLSDYGFIFDIVGAKCTQTHQQAESPYTNKDNQHGEWHAEYHLQCTESDEGYQLTAPLFSHYQGVETLIVQSITDHGQAQYHLTKDNNTAVLK